MLASFLVCNLLYFLYIVYIHCLVEGKKYYQPSRELKLNMHQLFR